MTRLHKFILRIVPEAWARDIETQSRRWMMRCACGFEQSVWAAGGVRWKARGNPRRLRRCAHCGQQTWHTLDFKIEGDRDV